MKVSTGQQTEMAGQGFPKGVGGADQQEGISVVLNKWQFGGFLPHPLLFIVRTPSDLSNGIL